MSPFCPNFVFHGRGIADATFVSNYFEGNSQAKWSSVSALLLEEGPDQLRTINIFGGYFTTGGVDVNHTGIRIGNYQTITIMGADLHSGFFSPAVNLYGWQSKATLVGVNGTWATGNNPYTMVGCTL